MFLDRNNIAYEEDLRQKELDECADVLPKCALCGDLLYPGDKFHTAHHQIVCIYCKAELDEDWDIVEVGS